MDNISLQRVRKQDRLELLRTTRSHRSRQCKHTEVLPQYVKARGLVWVRLYEVDGTKTYRCQTCVQEITGFLPNDVRLMRTKRVCGCCGKKLRVIGFRTPLPLPEGRTFYACLQCFKDVGVASRV